MCGICGWFNKRNNIDIGIVLGMNQIAKHRGPDDEGYALISDYRIEHFSGDDSIGLPYEHISAHRHKDVFLAFGHRRLSIIDVSSAGHQPMQTDDGKLCITFNGEIYNYIEVRAELELLGHSFHSASDTEVLLTAYREWGEECVYHLNGMWGFAIWDAEKRKIFCSRDRLGAKPFHYFIDDDNFVFGSEMKQLTQNTVIPRVMNDEILTTFMLWSISDYSEETLIKDIKVLRGGYNLSYLLPQNETETAHVKIYCYWDIDTECKKSQDAIKKTFDFHKDAVKIRLRSDVPIGIMLSGGLDSSALVSEITSFMKGQGIEAKDINTYTSCYENFKAGDERMFAEQVNKYCGTKENLVFPDETDTLNAFKDMVWHMEGLVGFGSMGGYLTLREVAKHGNKVIINGQDADETMFGYERYYTWYLRDVLKENGFVSYIREMKLAVKNSRLRYKDILGYNIYFGNAKIRKIRCRNRMKPYITKRVLRQFDFNTQVEKYLIFDNLKKMQYNEIRGTQLTHILRMDDRSYMAFSMESRVPFIDYRFIESAIQIPERSKIRNGYTKYLMRKFIEKKLPNDVVWRKNKMGWPSPRERWIKRLDKDAVEKLFDNPRSCQYFNIPKIEKLWKKNPNDFAFEKFLSVELFMRLFDVAAPVPCEKKTGVNDGRINIV